MNPIKMLIASICILIFGHVINDMQLAAIVYGIVLAIGLIVVKQSKVKK